MCIMGGVLVVVYDDKDGDDDDDDEMADNELFNIYICNVLFH